MEHDARIMQKQESIVIYTSEDGQTKVDVRMEKKTVWLTQAQMAELFQKKQNRYNTTYK